MAKPIFTQIIERARAYVAVRSHWTRYTLALTGNNRDCEPTDAKASRFCAYGALVRAALSCACSTRASPTPDARSRRALHAGQALDPFGYNDLSFGTGEVRRCRLFS